MSFSVYNKYVVGQNNSPIANATVLVNREDNGAQAVLYADPVGSPKGNNFLTTAAGLASFYAEGLAEGYKITVTHPDLGGGQSIFRNVQIGEAKGFDVGDDGPLKLLTRDQLDLRYNRVVLNNTSAITDPTVSNDSSQGYSFNSVWYNTALDEAYKCFDATIGAAVWQTTTLDLGDLGSIVTLNQGTAPGEIQLNSENAAQFSAIDYSILVLAGTAITLTGAHNGRLIKLTADTDIVVTVPEQATEAITNGFQCVVERAGDGKVTFVQEGSDTFDSADDIKTLDIKFAAATVVKQLIGEWWMAGGLKLAGIEPTLGNPAFDGFTLVSTAGGVRSWVPHWQSQKLIQRPADLGGTLLSTSLYYIDGVINMDGSGISVEVPVGGLSFAGLTPDVSKIICTDAAYTMFTAPVGGSGNVTGRNYTVTTSGAGSKVYDLVGATGFEAFEFTGVNYDDCTDLGVIDNYRQGLEINTGRFGGQPSLELKGAWSGGFFMDTSIVRNIDDAMTAALFVAGAGFVMQSRFRTNLNADLGANAPLLDFAPSNMPNAGTLQLRECIISRNGVFSPDDSTLLPNITEAAIASKFNGNVGLRNTFVGGKLDLTTEVETNIVASATFYTLAGTWTASDLQHFDSPANGQLRHIGISPIEYVLVGDLIIDGGPNDEIVVRLRRFNSGAATTETIGSQTRQINNFQGGRDVAFLSLTIPVTLLNGDYVFLEVANNTDTTNITLDVGSCVRIEAR